MYEPTSDAAECSLSSDLLCQDIMIDGNRNAVQHVTQENIYLFKIYNAHVMILVYQIG